MSYAKAHKKHITRACIFVFAITALIGCGYLAKVVIGIKFQDGVEVAEVDQTAA